jgi:hypothetical protein
MGDDDGVAFTYSELMGGNDDMRYIAVTRGRMTTRSVPYAENTISVSKMFHRAPMQDRHVSISLLDRPRAVSGRRSLQRASVKQQPRKLDNTIVLPSDQYYLLLIGQSHAKPH